MLEKQEVEHVAGLARLSLTDNEVVQFQKDLTAVLEFFAQLSELEIDQDVLSGAQVFGVARADQVREAVSKNALIEKNIPKSRDGYIEVQSVF